MDFLFAVMRDEDEPELFDVYVVEREFWNDMGCLQDDDLDFELNEILEEAGFFEMTESVYQSVSAEELPNSATVYTSLDDVITALNRFDGLSHDEGLQKWIETDFGTPV